MRQFHQQGENEAGAEGLPTIMTANFALHRITARLRFLLKLKVHGGAARGEPWR